MKFFTSKWFSNTLGKTHIIASTIPSILALMPLRHKFTAHRQQDDHRKDDCKSLGLNEFGLMPALSDSLEKPDDVKIEYQFPTKQRDRLLKKHKIPLVKEIEYFGNNNHLITFTPTQIHHRIINEAINLLQHFFNFQP